MNVVKEHISAQCCQLKYVPNAWQNRTPIVSDKDTLVKNIPLFFGSVISPIIIEPRGPSIPIATPWRNLAVIRPPTLLTRRSRYQPTRTGKMVRRWDFFLPMRSRIAVTMKFPPMRAKPTIDAEIEKGKI